MYRIRTLALITLLVAGAPWSTALAQTARSGSTGNAQLMQQLQQLASERTSLQAENARMKKELGEITKERDSLKSGRAALDQRSKASEVAIARNAKERETAEAENAKLKERMQELIAKFRETAQTLRDVEAERTTFKQSLAMKDQELTSCAQRNEALFKLNGEVLTRFESQGFWSRAAAAEPFTRLKRVELQNLVDDYKYRAEEQKVTTAPAASSNPEQR
jgi:chromosome segregation ATPase